MKTAAIAPQAWISSLHEGLDALETALLKNDALAVEQASAQVHGVLQSLLSRVELASQGPAVREDLHAAARRFSQLRQAVLRASAQSQRAVSSLLPQQNVNTYQRRPGQMGGRGPSQGYLSA